MKILCVCQRGNKRSVALAYLLKDKYHHDALSAGWQANSNDTLEMLFSWADRIIVLQESIVGKIIQQFRSKVIVFDVGEDRWQSPFEGDLLNQLDVFIHKSKIEMGDPECFNRQNERKTEL